LAFQARAWQAWPACLARPGLTDWADARG
jgi:hypothetical protein